jgi:hypothetical protein
MESIAQIEGLFSGIPMAEPSEFYWHTESVPSISSDRLLLSRGSNGDYCLFLKGSLASFGRLPSLACMEHREDSTDAKSGVSFPALRIRAPRVAYGNRAIAHVAYETTQRIVEDPDVDNSSLIQRVSWILGVLGHRESPLRARNQRGLAAECILLGHLLQRGRERGIAPDGIIDRWHGPTGGRRDFSGGQIAIEVKATASATRRHRIDSLSQLDTDESEYLFIYSMGLRHDLSYRKCLTDYVDEIITQLVSIDGRPLTDARDRFEAKLNSAGYDRSHDSLYRSGPGILQNANLPARLFRVEDLERLRITSFKNDALPRMVVNVSYDLELSAEPVTRDDMNAALDAMIFGE